MPAAEEQPKINRSADGRREDLAVGPLDTCVARARLPGCNHLRLGAMDSALETPDGVSSKHSVVPSANVPEGGLHAENGFGPCLGR